MVRTTAHIEGEADDDDKELAEEVDSPQDCAERSESTGLDNELLKSLEDEDCQNLDGNKQQDRKRKHKTKQQKRKREFVYGNYDRYYGYRIDHDLSEDPRVKFLSREWLEGKDCLDIGCNEGILTILLAYKYSCRKMVGVDIDHNLIHKARLNLKKKAEMMMDQGFRESLRLPQAAEVRGDEAKDFRVNGGKLEDVELLERVQFMTQNYLESYVKKATFDTVICLSVTKWIHLNWGDEGLIKLFSKIFQELRPGGMLLLEPQPWKSYMKKRRVSEVARKHFNEAVIRPDDFPSLLTEKIGFRSCQEISSDIPQSTKGFNRPLFLYYK